MGIMRYLRDIFRRIIDEMLKNEIINQSLDLLKGPYRKIAISGVVVILILFCSL